VFTYVKWPAPFKWPDYSFPRGQPLNRGVGLYHDFLQAHLTEGIGHTVSLFYSVKLNTLDPLK